jgi:hypothetical protein
MTDWKTLAQARGLELSDAELTKLAGSMDALEPAYQEMAAKLTHDIEPATILAEEALAR